MRSIEEALQSLNLQSLAEFFDHNAGILHRGRYHREGFDVHCYLVIGNMLAEYEAGRTSIDAVIAACLHDIAKPRTAALNKRGDACFYGHEKVTDEELASFLDPGYPGFERVAAMVRAHMLPHQMAEQASPKRQKRSDALLERFGEAFGQDLAILAECDDKGCVRDDADLPAAIKAAEETRRKLLLGL